MSDGDIMDMRNNEEDNYKALATVAKKVFANLVANEDAVKALKTFNKLANSPKLLTEAALTKAGSMKFSKREVPKQTKEPKLQIS